MPPRFFAPELTDTAGDVTLPSGESTHLARVLRLREGDEVEVFDGRGLVRAGTVQRSTPAACRIALGDTRPATPEPPAPIVVAQGLLKGDAMDAVIRDATVLGAIEIWPMATARTNVPSRAAQASQERWARVAVAAAKQCGRAVLPRISPVRTLDAVIAETCPAGHARLWLTEPGAGDDGDADVPRLPLGVCLAIGPEGGWAPAEVAAALAAGWRPWTLMPVTLRAEHMALAALSVVRYAWDGPGRRRST